MGLVCIDGRVKEKSAEADVRFFVDSGATYTLLALDVWRSIGLTPKKVMDFTPADGTLLKRSISECFLMIPQGEGHTPVILGEEGDESLLGAVTLEILGLRLNPFNRRLEPLKMILA